MILGSQKAASVAIVVVMMMAAIAMFLIYDSMAKAFPDEHKDTLEYTFSGTLDGEMCTGSGVREYLPETEADYVYSLDYSVRSANHEKSGSVGLIFDTNDDMVSQVYTYVGVDVYNGIEVKVWTVESYGIHYTFYTGGASVLYKITMVDAESSLIGELIPKN
jgi:hypothetical protein